MSKLVTHSILYVLPTIALILAVIGVVLAGFSTHNVSEIKKHTNSQPIINNIANANGFSSLNIKGQLQLETSVSSGLIGIQSNSLISAPSSDVMNATLGGFVSNPNQILLPTDTILSGLEKTTLLKQTPLSGFVPVSGSFQETDTVLTTLEKLSYTQTATNTFRFGISTTRTNNANSYVDMWPLTPQQGTLTLAANTLTLGQTLSFVSTGILTGGSAGQNIVLTFLFFVASFSQVFSAGWVYFTGSYNWKLESTLQMIDATHANVTSTLRIFSNPIGGFGESPIFASSFDSFLVDPTVAHNLSLDAKISSPGNVVLLSLNNASGGILYQTF